MKALSDMKDETMNDEDEKELEIKVIQNTSSSPDNNIDSITSKSDFSDRSKNTKVKLKLADGNVDKASMITEGMNSQMCPSKSGASNKISVHGILVSRIVRLLN